MTIYNLQFAKHFRKLRLKSEFSTLQDFGNALAENGLIFEDSILSRWQKGNRTPQRKVLLTMIKIFIEKGAINSLTEINSFLETAEYGYLTNSELEELPKDFFSTSPFQVPSEIPHFIGRETYIEKALEEISGGKIVLIYGPAGIGKTALAIKLGHILRDRFLDGVLWFRLDVLDTASILSAIAYAFGENISEIKDEEIRASIVRSLLSTKKAFLILDNAELKSNIRLLIPNSSSCGVIITSKYKNLEIPSVYSSVFLKPLDQRETFSLFRSILGSRYVKRNRQKLLGISELFSGMPLAINVFAKQLFYSSNSRKLYNKAVKEELKLDSLTYEDRNLYTAIKISYEELDVRTKKVFISLGVFAGKDFSKEAVATINNLNTSEAEEILEELVNRSLVEKSSRRRYRLHPLIRIFVKNKIVNLEVYSLALDYYINLLESGGRGKPKFYPIVETELDNILFIFEKSYDLLYYEKLVSLWEYLGIFLWDTGRWSLVEELGKKIYKGTTVIRNKYAKSLCCIRELSWLYLWQDKISKAGKLAKEGLDIALLIKSRYLIAFGKQRLGMIYHVRGNQRKAHQLLKESLNLFKNLKEKIHICNNLLYLGHTMRKLKKIKLGRGYYLKSLNLASKIPDQPKLKAMCMHYLGETSLDLGNFKKAIKYFSEELKINMNIKRKAGIGWSKLGLALAKGEVNEVEESLRLFYEAREIFYQLDMADQVKRVNENLRYLIPIKI